MMHEGVTNVKYSFSSTVQSRLRRHCDRRILYISTAVVVIIIILGGINRFNKSHGLGSNLETDRSCAVTRKTVSVIKYLNIFDHIVVNNSTTQWPGRICSPVVDTVGNLWRNKRIVIAGDNSGRALFISIVQLLTRNPEYVFQPTTGCALHLTNNCADARHGTVVTVPEFDIIISFVWTRFLGTGEFKRGDDVESRGNFSAVGEFDVRNPRQKFRWLVTTLMQDHFYNSNDDTYSREMTKLHRNFLFCPENGSCLPDILFLNHGLHSLGGLRPETSSTWDDAYKSELIEAAALVSRWLPRTRVWWHAGLPITINNLLTQPDPYPIMGWFFATKLYESAVVTPNILLGESLAGAGTINAAVLSKNGLVWIMSLHDRFNRYIYHWMNTNSDLWDGSMFGMHVTYTCDLLSSITQKGKGGATACSIRSNRN